MIPSNVKLIHQDKPFKDGCTVSLSIGYDWPIHFEPYRRMEAYPPRNEQRLYHSIQQEKLFNLLNEVNLSSVSDVKVGVSHDSLFIATFKTVEDAIVLFNQVVNLPGCKIKARIFPENRVFEAKEETRKVFRRNLFKMKFKFKQTFDYLDTDTIDMLKGLLTDEFGTTHSQWSYAAKTFRKTTFYTSSVEDLAMMNMMYNGRSEISEAVTI